MQIIYKTLLIWFDSEMFPTGACFNTCFPAGGCTLKAVESLGDGAWLSKVVH